MPVILPDSSSVTSWNKQLSRDGVLKEIVKLSKYPKGKVPIESREIAIKLIDSLIDAYSGGIVEDEAKLDILEVAHGIILGHRKDKLEFYEDYKVTLEDIKTTLKVVRTIRYASTRIGDYADSCAMSEVHELIVNSLKDIKLKERFQW